MVRHHRRNDHLHRRTALRDAPDGGIYPGQDPPERKTKLAVRHGPKAGAISRVWDEEL